jgi:hypothetical protein
MTYAVIGVVVGGQIGLFIGALVLGGIRAQNPRLRGILLAAASVVKPQSVLAAPVALIAERNSRAIAWAIPAGSTLLLLSVLLFGLDPWLSWAREMPKFRAYLGHRGIDRMDVGLYGLAVSLGLPGWTFVVGIPLGIATSWLAFRTETPTLDRYAAFVTSTVLMSPYTLYYDLAGLTFVSAAMLLDRSRSPLIWFASALIVSSVFASAGIILLALILSDESARRSGASRRSQNPAAEHEPDHADDDHEEVEVTTGRAARDQADGSPDDRKRDDQPIGPAEQRDEGNQRADQRDEADDQ